MASLFHLISCLLLLLVQLLFFTSAQRAYTNITLGESLSNLDQNPYWTSPSGDFAFGFYPHQDLFLLAIWFERIPLKVKTIIWTANQGNPVERGATIQLTSNGVLSLTSRSGTEIWKAQPTDDSRVTSAAMLNTGNLVLTTTESTIVWSSFKEPTDTILPTQTLELDGRLSSRQTEEDYTITNGRFEFILQNDGNLVLYTKGRTREQRRTSDAYYASNTVNNGTQLVFNQSGYIYLTLKSGGPISLASERPESTRDFYQRATLDFDGVFRQYTYPRTLPSNGRWPNSWSTIYSLPEDICSAGSGVCGFNGYCQLNQEQRPECKCPPGYTFIDPENTFSGCNTTFVPPSCDSTNETDGFEMRDLPDADWPFDDYESFERVDEDWCEQRCLNDCLCAAAIVHEGRCWLKKFQLSRGYVRPGIKALIKVGDSPTIYVPPPSTQAPQGQEKKSSINIVAIVVPVVIAAVLLSIVTIFFCLRRKKGFVIVEDVDQISNVESLQLKLTTVAAATENFSEANKLGEGGFGPVYKGKLSDGQEIAVKRLSRNSGQGVAEFKNEILLLAKLQHRNLVRLLGFCLEGEEKLLIYEFVINASLDQFIFDPIKRTLLDWGKRYNIIGGIARGLLYLHEDSQVRIIHRDLKASNILLNDQMNPKISDFGTARLFMMDQTQANTRRIAGTFGYMPPEYVIHGHFSVKSDVFSFGVLVLELISGKKNTSLFETECADDLLCYAWRRWREGTALELLDPVLRDHYNENEVTRCIHIGLLCVQEDVAKRPTMATVVLMLSSYSVNLALPSPPPRYGSFTISGSMPHSNNEVSVTELSAR